MHFVHSLEKRSCQIEVSAIQHYFHIGIIDHGLGEIRHYVSKKFPGRARGLVLKIPELGNVKIYWFKILPNTVFQYSAYIIVEGRGNSCTRIRICRIITGFFA